MSELKKLNVRVQNKYNTYDEWYAANPTLLKGEIAVVEIPGTSTNKYGSHPTEPTMLFKIGDGKSDFKTLPWASALAADVYAWAKNETLQVADIPALPAEKITELDAYISNYVETEMGISIDTDTQYQLVAVEDNARQFKLMGKSKGSEEYTIESGVITIPDYDDSEVLADIEALEGRMDAVEGRLTTAEGKISALEQADVAMNAEIGQKADVSVTNDHATRIGNLEVASATHATKDELNQAKSAIDAEVAKKATAEALGVVEGRVTANEEAIETLNGNAETAGSVDYKIAAKFATLMENPDEAMNSIQELVDWTTEHAADALELSNQVTTNKNSIATLNGSETEAGSVAKAAKDAENNAKDYADGLNTTMSARVKALEDDHIGAAELEELNGAIADAAAAATTADGKAVNAQQAVDALIAADGAVTKNAADIATNTQDIADLQSDLDTLAGRVTTNEGNIAEKANAAEVKATTDALDERLDSAEEAINGLKPIASSGSVKDLDTALNDGDWITLCCGDATTLI